MGMRSLTASQFATDWPIFSAVSVLTALPIVIVFLSAYKHRFRSDKRSNQVEKGHGCEAFCQVCAMHSPALRLPPGAVYMHANNAGAEYCLGVV